MPASNIMPLSEQVFACRRRFRKKLVAICSFLLLTGLMSQPAMADINRETPWHETAHGYLNSLFLLNLKPINWSLIERSLTTSFDDQNKDEPTAVRLQDIDQASGTAHWQAIETALVAKRADALYASLTKAMSAAIRHYLAEASATFDVPSMASANIQKAQALYRAFADTIRQTDPEGFRSLGLAWLEIASSIRQDGVIEVVDIPADRASFAAARTLLVTYLKNNYEPDNFQVRSTFEPIPEELVVANPAVKVAAWLPPGTDLRDQDPLPRLVMNFKEHGVSESDLFLVALGNMLFTSPEIFGGPAKDLGLACSTCHNGSDINRRLYIPGLSPHPGAVDVDGGFFNPRFNDHRADPLDIPSLRGLRFTAPYGRDGRFSSLRDFTRNVIVNEFQGQEPSPLILDALVAYMLEFDFLPAPNLERGGQLNAASSAAAKRGQALFIKAFPGMNDRSCASCHIPGSHFTDNRTHDIGSAGYGATTGFSGALDTPTLLGIRHTAPYFHDGRFNTLLEVVAWFDDQFALGLGDQGRADLTAFLEAVGEGSEPYQTFDQEETRLGLSTQQRLVHLSPLNTLIADRDIEHAELLLGTVARAMQLDASAITNRDAQEKILELAEDLWQIRDVIKQEAWDEASAAWQSYQIKAQDYDTVLR